MSAFTIDIPQPVLDDLRARLAATRWPTPVAASGWDRGTDIDYLRRLVDHWQNGFDWRSQEAKLNRLNHELHPIDGLDIHIVHQRSERSDATPLLLLHGWPDSFWRYLKVLPLLTDFHVVVPSLPGYGFSGQPTDPPLSEPEIADVAAQLMGELGYDRFVVSGGDVGSGVAEALARNHGDRLIGLHLTDVPYWHLFTVDPASLSDAEQRYLEAGQGWQMSEGAYALMQSTKPMTAAYGLTDSPVGLAAWIVEKLRAWSDCGGDVESRFTMDEVLVNLTIYWATATIGSSFTVYYEDVPHDAADRVRVPTGFSIFPKDIVPAPREFGERFFDVRMWNELPRGGHFAAFEEPELFAEQVRTFIRGL